MQYDYSVKFLCFFYFAKKGNLMVWNIKCDFNVHAFSFIMKPYRLWYIQTHVREKIGSPSVRKGPCTCNPSDTADFEVLFQRYFQVNHLALLRYLYTFPFMMLLLLVFLPVSSAGLWAAWMKVVRTVDPCTSRAWPSTYIKLLTMSQLLLWVLPSWSLHVSIAQEDILSEPSCISSCPWRCPVIILLNFVFTSSHLSSAVCLPSFILLQGYPGGLNAHSQGYEKGAENTPQIQDKSAQLLMASRPPLWEQSVLKDFIYWSS